MEKGAHDESAPPAAVRGQKVLDLLHKAIDMQGPLVQRNIARACQRKPEATPAEVIRNLERMYVSALTGTGAAVGGAAAAPGVGTGVALALSAGEFLSSLELSALFALSIAEVHGVPIDELERRRTIVLGIMLGGSASATITKVAERTGQHWGRQVVAKVPVETLRQINRVLGPHFITKYGTKQGIIVLGRAAPFGIGAVIGGGANAALATLSVRAGRRAFGPPPASWPGQTPSRLPPSE
ncbi:hypothetical protein AWW66_07590 [Micromonospora rosaria]|uniref:EcsC family protein n=1 Tax=Micromonospora rosaria TaxID=47874 RepID=A0A136PVV5_9ACTN|nr:hypothetical protein [Micromonospora rosaria]KXK62532.1 hypothetical protein AWW66_07590 [Micromonospora rosaria]